MDAHRKFLITFIMTAILLSSGVEGDLQIGKGAKDTFIVNIQPANATGTGSGSGANVTDVTSGDSYVGVSPTTGNVVVSLTSSATQWFYNQTTPFTTWLSTFLYNYNQTAPANTYVDNQISYINNTLNIQNLYFYNKSEIDNLIPSALTYYFWDVNDTINATYKIMNTTQNPTITNHTASSLANGDTIVYRINRNTNLTGLNGGTLHLHTSATKTGGTKDLQIVGKLHKLQTNGTIVLLATTDTSPILVTNTLTNINLFANVPLQTLNVTDMLLWKLEAVVTGSGTAPSVVITVGGTTQNGLDLPVTVNDIILNENDPVFRAWNASFLYNYNQTIGANTYTDTRGFVTSAIGNGTYLINDSNANLSDLNVTRRFSANRTLFVTDTGLVGIGTATPTHRLTIQDTSTTSVNLSQILLVDGSNKLITLPKLGTATGATALFNSSKIVFSTGSWDTNGGADNNRDWRVYGAGASAFFGFPDLVFEQNSAPQVVFTRANGIRVGIGQSVSPTRTLDVRGDGNFSNTIYVYNGTDLGDISRYLNVTFGQNLTAYTCSGTDKVTGIRGNGTMICGADSGASNIFNQHLNTTNHVQFANLTSFDNVTIGNKLLISSALPRIDLQDTSAGEDDFRISPNSNYIEILDTSSTLRNILIISGATKTTGAGFIGIGTPNPTAKLTINITNFTGGGANAPVSGFYIYNYSGADLLFVNGSSGNVGIGTATPTHTLNVVGNINNTANIITSNLRFNSGRPINGTNCGAGAYTNGTNNAGKQVIGSGFIANCEVYFNNPTWKNNPICSITLTNATAGLVNPYLYYVNKSGFRISGDVFLGANNEYSWICVDIENE